ncbi:hypothetical protein ACWCYY_06265 [Kitasatospora sp. NPDC001664]
MTATGWKGVGLLLCGLAMVTGCSGGGSGGGSGATATTTAPPGVQANSGLPQGTSEALPGEPDSAPAVEGSGRSSPQERTSPGGKQGGFDRAGMVSSRIDGIWPNARVSVENRTDQALTVVVSQVGDCHGRAAVPVDDAAEPRTIAARGDIAVAFAFQGPSPGGFPLTTCGTVTVEGSPVPVKGAVTSPSFEQRAPSQPGPKSASPGGAVTSSGRPTPSASTS